VWETGIFKKINRNMTWMWAGMFTLSTAIALAPVLFGLKKSLFANLVVPMGLPLLLMVGVGVPFNKKYPARYQRRIGMEPVQTPAAPGPEMREEPGEGVSVGEGETRRSIGEVSSPQSAHTCRELLSMMPAGFRKEATELNAVYQFEISGQENFVAHLSISGGRCVFVDGPHAKPDVTIKSPSDVWLAVSKGEMDGETAFMTGKYKAEGDLTLLMRLRSLFGA